jgi:hypothetical protein
MTKKTYFSANRGLFIFKKKMSIDVPVVHTPFLLQKSMTFPGHFDNFP